MSIVCVISARGGSAGVKNKNIRIINGKPLIVWSIEQALLTPEIDEVFVSTDSSEIKKIALKHGAKVPFKRPKNLSNSTAPKFKVWKHALRKIEKLIPDIECYVDLDCTSPLRDVSDITAAIYQYKRNKNKIDVVFSVCAARKNPYFNLVEKNESGYLRVSKPLKKRIIRRQDCPEVLEHVASIYVMSPEFIKSKENLDEGRSEGYKIDYEKSFDIDSELDFKIVSFLLADKKDG